MLEFIPYLNDIREAADWRAREDAVGKAKHAAEKILAGKELPESTLDEEELTADSEYYKDTYGNWVLTPPAKRKKRKKQLAALISLTSIQNQIEQDSVGNLIKQIQRCKNINELKRFERGHVLHGVKIPAYADRLVQLTKEKKIDVKKQKRITASLEKKRAVLRKKRTADRVAIGLTAILSILGVGLTCGIAMVMILPVMPLAALIPVLIVFTLLGGYVEGFVFYDYVKRFCRNILRGFWHSIDNHILNREAKKLQLKDRHDLSHKQIAHILFRSRKESIIKKVITIASIPFAIAAGVGFTALIFSQVASFLPLIGILGGVAAVAAPWALAAVVGPLYAIIMYSMIYQAIKHNIFAKIKNLIVDLFVYKDKQGNTWSNLSSKQKAKHVGLCILKGFGIAIVLGISVLATVLSAGAWLQSSVSFFTTALGVIETAANAIGWAIGASLIATNLWFSIENSLETVKTFTQVSWRRFKAACIDTITHPKKLGLALLSFLPFAIHVAGTGAVDSLGTDAVGFGEALGEAAKPIAGTIGILEEVEVDAHAMPGIKKDKHEDNHEGHHHGNVKMLYKMGLGLFHHKHQHNDKYEKELPLRRTPGLKTG